MYELMQNFESLSSQKCHKFRLAYFLTIRRKCAQP